MSRRSLAEALAAVQHVDGWLSYDQVARLYAAAADVRPGEQVVEIGSFRGRSTIVLACAVPDDVMVVAIDPHAGNDRGPQEISGYAHEAQDDHQVFISNVAAAGVADRVRHVREFSDQAQDAVKGRIALLFIDGAHRYAPARSDICTWGARVQPGGSLLIHDSFSSVGVTLAICRELLFGAQFRYVGRSRSLAEYRLDLPPGRRVRAANALSQLAQLPWFAKNIALKLLLTLGLSGLVKRLTGHAAEWPY